MTVSELLQERLQNALQKIGIAIDEPLQITATANPRHGDYQTNAAMVLGKKLKQNPRNLAGLVVANISVNDIGPPPEVAGPGFINFRLSKEFVDHRLSDLALDQRLGVERTGKPKTIVIDFSSPNIAKPMHVGHIRSTILGDVLAKVTRFLGHQVVTDNHIGDWGTQFGKVIYGWKHLLIPENLEADPVAELVRIYREADTAAKKDAGILEECRRELVKLQQGDDENRRIWQRCVDLSIAEFSKVYDRLGVRFDCQLGESFITRNCPGLWRSCWNADWRRSATALSLFGTARSVGSDLLSGNRTVGMGTLRRTLRRWSTGGIAGGRKSDLVRGGRASAAPLSAIVQSGTSLGLRGRFAAHCIRQHPG